MATPKLTLLVDCVSPFAYMAFYATRCFPIFQQCEITYIPIFLGGLMHLCDNKTPLFIKNKGKWIDIERLRWAKAFDIPMTKTMPQGFPPVTLNVQRALTAVHNHQPDKFAEVLETLYHALWVERKAIHKPEIAVPCFAAGLGVSEAEAKAVFDQGGTPEMKQKLTQNTNEAFQKGAFGLPWFIATNSRGETEQFWGFDHLGQVADFLELGRPTASKGWKTML